MLANKACPNPSNRPSSIDKIRCRVGYQPPEAAPVSTRRYKKPVIVSNHAPPTERYGLKKLATNYNQVNSGVFVDSAYGPSSKDGRTSLCQKKGVIEAQQKYYGGK